MFGRSRAAARSCHPWWPSEWWTSSPARTRDRLRRNGSRCSRHGNARCSAWSAAGLSNAEIAARIHVVEGTVKVYVSTIFRQLGVKNRVQAAIIAHESGIIPAG